MCIYLYKPHFINILCDKIWLYIKFWNFDKKYSLSLCFHASSNSNELFFIRCKETVSIKWNHNNKFNLITITRAFSNIYFQSIGSTILHNIYVLLLTWLPLCVISNCKYNSLGAEFFCILLSIGIVMTYFHILA